MLQLIPKRFLTTPNTDHLRLPAVSLLKFEELCNSSMKSLNEFPPEVLALILRGEASFLVINLWKCGDKILNYNLTRGIESISLKDNTEWSTSRWPRCLSAFRRLTSLSVQINGLLMYTPMALLSEILKLPPTLEVLEIDSTDAIWDVPKPCKEAVDVVAVSRVNFASYHALLSCLDCETPFPLLKSAWICAPSLNRELSPMLVHLFSNAKIFKVDQWDHSVTPLPTLVETLEGSLFVHPMTPVTLPPSLKRISHLVADGPGVYPFNLQGITYDSLSLHCAWTANLAQTCPRSLTTLEAHGPDVDTFFPSIFRCWPDSLPSTLTTLRMDWLTLDDTLVSHLPRTLTSLTGSIRYLAADAINGVVMDLPNLQEWTDRMQLSIDPRFLDKFPPSVTSFLQLFSRKKAETLVNFVPKLPERLKVFEKRNFPLDFPSASIASLKHLESYSGIMQLDQLSFLPSSLTHIEFYLVELSQDDREIAMASLLHLTALRSLKLRTWSCEQFNLIPRSLKALDIGHLQHVNDSLGAVSIASQFSLLPPLLESLSIYHSSPDLFKAECFAQFSHLKSIQVNGQEPRVPLLTTVSRFDNARCFPDLRISGLPYAERFYKADSIEQAVPENAIDSWMWAHLDNEEHNPELKMSALAPSHWYPTIAEVANTLDSCMKETDDEKRLELVLPANQALRTGHVQNGLIELCFSPHWTARKLAIAVCLLEHENYIQFVGPARPQPQMVYAPSFY